MAVTLTTRALHTDLTTAAAVRERLGLGAGEQGPLLGRLIRGATSAIVNHCGGREFARVQVAETVKGYGNAKLMLTRTPIVTLGTILNDNEPVTDFTVDDAEAGLIYRQRGTDWTRQFGLGLLEDYPMPGSEAPLYAVAYWAGWLLPGDDVVSAGLSATASSKTYTLASGTMPLVVAGDLITVEGFTNAANNGTKTVVSRTAATIVVSETLVDEAANAESQRTLACRTLPEDIEEACLDTVKDWYLARQRDPAVESRTLGDLSVTYRAPSEIEGESSAALSYRATGLLAHYVRVR